MTSQGQRAVDELMDTVETLREQRDTLLAACKSALEYHTGSFKAPEQIARELQVAITKVEGKK